MSRGLLAIEHMRAGYGDAVERRKLTELRTTLLTLHKTLLDMERREYEREHGHVSPGELFRLVLDHQQFGWLHNISEFVVRLDETLAGEDTVTAVETGRAKGYRGAGRLNGGGILLGRGRKSGSLGLCREGGGEGGGVGAAHGGLCHTCHHGHRRPVNVNVPGVKFGNDGADGRVGS